MFVPLFLSNLFSLFSVVSTPLIQVETEKMKQLFKLIRLQRSTWSQSLNISYSDPHRICRLVCKDLRVISCIINSLQNWGKKLQHPTQHILFFFPPSHLLNAELITVMWAMGKNLLLVSILFGQRPSKSCSRTGGKTEFEILEMNHIFYVIIKNVFIFENYL